MAALLIGCKEAQDKAKDVAKKADNAVDKATSTLDLDEIKKRLTSAKERLAKNLEALDDCGWAASSMSNSGQGNDEVRAGRASRRPSAFSLLLKIQLSRVLTDRGTEYCGNPEQHEYQLYLAVEDIEHTKTKVRHPQTNGICERFHKTVLNEFYRVAFRKKLYTTIDTLQNDLDAWLREYNENRPHQGRWCFGQTPMSTFLDSLNLAREKMIAA